MKPPARPHPPRFEPPERAKRTAAPTSGSQRAVASSSRPPSEGATTQSQRLRTDGVAARAPRPPAEVVRAAAAGAAPGVAGSRSARRTVVSTRSASRFAERVELQRRLTRRRAYRTGAAILVVLALGWLGLLSPAFKVDPSRVVVTGADAIVARAAIDRVVSAHAAGIPLPRLNTAALRDRLLEIPGVREARVTRVWPRGLAVLLVTRRPVVAVPTAGAFVLLDIDGVQVGRSKAPGGLPVASVPAKNARTLRAVLEVLRGLPAGLAGEITKVGADSEDTVTMTMRGGATVVWGSAEDTQLKIRVLAVLRSAEQTKGARVFDVSAPTLPITRS